jgi:hypothetical protein
MPVNFLPVIFPVVLILIPMLFIGKGRKPFLLALGVSISTIGLIFLWSYVPGWILMAKANQGDAEAQYELARWYENHPEVIQQYLLWPCEPDVLTGYAWLEKAAKQDYPPALYALGVRLKYGIHVPRPNNWNGPDGNVFPQPERGQPYIDEALRLGFKPSVREEGYYWRVDRR